MVYRKGATFKRVYSEGALPVTNATAISIDQANRQGKLIRREECV